MTVCTLYKNRWPNALVPSAAIVHLYGDLFEKPNSAKGFVMAMYSTLQNHPKASEGELLESINANLCRCTGYRPIVTALKEISQKVNEGLDVSSKYEFPSEFKGKSGSFVISGKRVQWFA